MKLSGRNAERFCRRPDGSRLGALLFGPDAGLVSGMRQTLVNALTEGDDLRITRLDPAEARKSPAILHDALRARGFFPGRRVVLVEGARDSVAEMVAEAVRGLTPEDAFLVLEAEALTPRSPLRKLAEASDHLVSLGLYPDPPDGPEITEELRQRGFAHGLTPEAEALVTVWAATANRGSVARALDTIALYGLDRHDALGSDELVGLMPDAGVSALDQLFAAIAEGRTAEVRQLFLRSTASGISITQIVIRLGAYFRQLLAIATGVDGPAQARTRGAARRGALSGQATAWGATRLEIALRLIQETDHALRSGGGRMRPETAQVERCLIRLSMMARRRAP